MELNLAGKVAIVTGASRGIGKAISEILSAEGVKLTLVARSRDQLDDLSASLPTDSLPLAIDLREADSAARVLKATLEKFGPLDLLVNNAGATKRGDFLTLTDEEWTDGFALKFYGAMRLSRAAWTHLMKSKGSIINIIGVGGAHRKCRVRDRWRGQRRIDEPHQSPSRSRRKRRDTRQRHQPGLDRHRTTADEN